MAERCEVDYGHRWCLMCGSDNPLSFGLNFSADDHGIVYGSFQSHSGLQGYDGYMHGGVISALLDSVMTHCLFHRGVRAVTGELNIRFKFPVSCTAALDLRAWVKTIVTPLYYVEAELLYEQTVMARAKAKFMEVGSDGSCLQS
jgi:acyl-coenzyme A thioesterase PaaI-like protein